MEEKPKRGFFNLRIVSGDLFTAQCSLAHCVGADFRMGMGIAVQFKEKFGQVEYLKSQNATKGGCAILKVTNPDRYIYYLVTKEKTGAGCYPTYDTLKNSLTVMRDHMLANNIKFVAMPQIGCGLDRLEWNRVMTTLRYVFGEYDLDVTIYKFTPPKEVQH